MGHAERLGDPGVYLVGPRVPGDLFDDVAEDDVVGVGVVVRAARFAHPSGRLGDGDQLGRRPMVQRVVDDGGLVEVLAEAAGVVEELAWRDPVCCGQVGQVAVDAGVEIDASLFGQLQHDDGDECLGGTADVPRHVGIDRPAGRVERRGSGTDFGDRPIGVAERDARARQTHRRHGVRRGCGAAPGVCDLLPLASMWSRSTVTAACEWSEAPARE